MSTGSMSSGAMSTHDNMTSGAMSTGHHMASTKGKRHRKTQDAMTANAMTAQH
jgi:hypothetical protein